MNRYVALSERQNGPQSTSLRDITHLIWPESAFPFFLTREADALAQIAALLPERTTLITGGVRPPGTTPTPGLTRAYNSVYVIGHDGSILSIYDKVHLVPFGEYLPFQDYLEKLGLIALTKMRGGFIPGDRRRVLDIPRAPSALPLICYEIIFPGAAVPPGERAGWIINLTNDGWFGLSLGPHQHFQQARLRAIEEGLPLVRAANTGISAVVDGLGNIIAALPLGTEGIFDSVLPKPLPPTPYARFGDAPVTLLVGISFVIVLRLRRQSRRNKSQP
jgi:apolipoprotein N-acyltransferase